MRIGCGVVLVGMLLATKGSAGAQSRQVPDARALISNAVQLTGGEAVLRGVERVALQMMTQWQRTGFRTVPYTDRPSYERHNDIRDYSIPAWRNTRDFGSRKIINVIRDSVAVTDLGQGFQPLSVAYLDERAELFLYTPDRLLLALLDAGDAVRGRDTTIGGEPHRRVTATLHRRFLVTVFFHAGTGLPAMLRFRAGHPNDFGLVPWGIMPVEVWYSGWRSFDAISIPTQWDILRVGVPYKRMTVLGAAFNPVFAPDSFAVSAAQRAAYLGSTAVRPMHESIPVRGVRMIEPGLATTGTFGLPAGAVRAGPGWLLVGAGHAPFNFRQGLQLLDSLGAAPVSAVLAGNASTGNGGIVEAVDRGIAVWVSAASETFALRILAGAGRPASGLRRVAPGTVLGTGADRVLLEPLDLPNTPGSMMLFQPATGWLFLPDAESPLDVAVGRARAEAAGWRVAAVGTARTFHQPDPGRQ